MHEASKSPIGNHRSTDSSSLLYLELLEDSGEVALWLEARVMATWAEEARSPSPGPKLSFYELQVREDGQEWGAGDITEPELPVSMMPQVQQADSIKWSSNKAPRAEDGGQK